MVSIPEIFGINVFTDEVMKEKLPSVTYKAYRQSIEKGESLTIDIANVVANAMKEWAISKGATHYTHWFQPMTDLTAEKHDSFISPDQNGKILMEFSGKELIKGEPDASSFPNGGLRSTFEARGYTAWDPTSPAFVKDGVLCIPTAFCSYSGEALDQKTPLLKSMDLISFHMMRILKIFGTEAKRVFTTVGAEQEYFLIDKDVYNRRKDLLYCGRTLLGARPAKGQELSDHYFGAIKPRVHEFMKELNVELWKLGINAKTEHNEAAPAQHELAPIYATTNISIDQNQLMMETMKNVASKHGMVCLLHEKPFAGVNGSGKHNNWSISTDSGQNLLDPGKTPADNDQFLLILAAVIKAVDKYQGLLRMSVASAGNDYRLGGNEAPPAIVSIFLGDELERILSDIKNGNGHKNTAREFMHIGGNVLPTILRDNTDRNRTSPFAFTGNKFEFRMVGANQSVSVSNTVINTIIASVLDEFATILEESGDVAKDVNDIIVDTLNKHDRIIFNGNNYSEEWVEEAQRRGLLNLKSTPDCIVELEKPENIELFEKYGIFTRNELSSRVGILYDNYCNILHIEALTMLDMCNKLIIPAVIRFKGMVAKSVKNIKSISGNLSVTTEMTLLSEVTELLDNLSENVRKMEELISELKNVEEGHDRAAFYRDRVIPAMNTIREYADKLELCVGEDYWPFPAYGSVLYSVR